MKMLKTIRFDISDDHVFAEAAGPDEWAIPGSFAFVDLGPQDLIGKTRQAFANGFLSLAGFGRATFTSVAEIGQAEHDRLVDALAAHFVAHYGAPDIEAARPTAEAEITFTLGLCEGLAINSLLTVRRHFNDEGAIREEFRTVDPPGEAPHAKVWNIVEDES